MCASAQSMHLRCSTLTPLCAPRGRPCDPTGTSASVTCSAPCTKCSRLRCADGGDDGRREQHRARQEHVREARAEEGVESHREDCRAGWQDEPFKVQRVEQRQSLRDGTGSEARECLAVA